MKLNITTGMKRGQELNDPFAGKGFSFSAPAFTNDTITENGTARNARGGTELMREALYKYVDNDLLNKFQIISSRVRNIEPNKPTLLWMHDTFDDPECKNLSDPEYRKLFNKFIFVSYHQMTSFQLAHGIPHEQCVVIQNAIEPFKETKKPKKPIKLIYHTTPHRGLELLYPVFEFVHTKCKEDGIDIELDVFSSFEIYGWKNRDVPYKDLFKRLEDHPAINYHGFQPNDVVRSALYHAHIFAYPNIWPETSCISLMEAMSAGLVCITPNFGALPETGANFPITYPWVQDPQKHATIHANILYKIITDYWQESLQSALNLQRIYANTFYSWETRKNEWDAMLRNIASELQLD